MSRVGAGFTYDDLEAEVVEFEGGKIRLAAPMTLFADATALSEKFNLSEDQNARYEVHRS